MFEFCIFVFYSFNFNSRTVFANPIDLFAILDMLFAKTRRIFATCKYPYIHGSVFRQSHRLPKLQLYPPTLTIYHHAPTKHINTKKP